MLKVAQFNSLCFVRMASINRDEFNEKVVALAHEIHELAFSYPGDLEEPGYCLLSHAAELLDLITELKLV